MHLLSRSLDRCVKYNYNLLKSIFGKTSIAFRVMKETKAPHLKLVKNPEFLDRIIQFHIDNRYNTVEKLESMWRDRINGDRCEVFGLIQDALNEQKEYHDLPEKSKKNCPRETSRALSRYIDKYLLNNKGNRSPKVNTDYSGIEKLLLNSTVETDAEMEKVKEYKTIGVKSVKTPTGWEITF